MNPQFEGDSPSPSIFESFSILIYHLPAALAGPSSSSSEVQAIGHHSWPAGRGRVPPLLRIYMAFFVSIIFDFSIAKNLTFGSAGGQCTRAHAQIGAFFSLACAFLPHSFKSKEASSGRDRDGALAWLAAWLRYRS